MSPRWMAREGCCRAITRALQVRDYASAYALREYAYMRDYGRVYSRFWSSEDIRELSDDARLLALYLLTCLHGHLSGAFFLPIGYVTEDLQWSSERVTEGFAELSAKGFATRCERTKWVWVCRYLHWNSPENPNQMKAALKQVASVPEKCVWRSDFQRAFSEFEQSQRGPERVPQQKSLGTLPQGFRNQEQYKDQNQDQKQKQKQDMDEEGDPPTRAGGGGAKANGKTNGNGHANAGAPPASPPIETETFARIREIFPQRAGSHRWADALIAYHEQLRAGFTEAQLLEGVQRYRAYCEAEQIEGQVCVQSARVFFGPNRGFLERWDPGKRTSATDRWLREQEAKDAQH